MYRLVLIAVVLLGIAGCATLGYYGHAIGGHYSILGRADPIDELLDRSNVDPALKRKLERVVAIRDFASRELGLPDNASYRRYADLERPFATQFGDLRPFLFPQEMATYTSGEPLPMMPNKRENWRRGFISQYNGIRESGRYAKYHQYGHDMSLVKDDLLTGYREAELYNGSHFDKDKQQLALIYGAIADHIEADNIDHLIEANKKIEYKDALDLIMEALE